MTLPANITATLQSSTGFNVKFQPQTDLVIKSDIGTAGFIGVTRLDDLLDVVEASPANNSTLVYSSANDTYVVKMLDLDGGTF